MSKRIGGLVVTLPLDQITRITKTLQSFTIIEDIVDTLVLICTDAETSCYRPDQAIEIIVYNNFYDWATALVDSDGLDKELQETEEIISTMLKELEAASNLIYDDFIDVTDRVRLKDNDLTYPSMYMVDSDEDGTVYFRAEEI